jgi:vacuolar protein sorting-associated protein 35
VLNFVFLLCAPSCRKVFIFIQDTIASIAQANAESAIKLYLEMSLVADRFAAAQDDTADFAGISFELLTQAFSLYEEAAAEPKSQQRCIEVIAGTLTASKSLNSQQYEALVTKTAQFAAKVLKKPVQCQLVALCAYLFYPAGEVKVGVKYSNPQRSLECLQRALKLADACTTENPIHVRLFIDLLDHYLFFFENGNPLITHAYITGLIALIKEHIDTREDQAVIEAKAHFLEVIQHIKRRKRDPKTVELFESVQIDRLNA